ncbi:MAG: hypothetical protein HY514_03890 [Candidatus Aenigmarchaeota archaeon]|nr:hypothetical protein [Candidatus Aenigmarchaeota archaeon]
MKLFKKIGLGMATLGIAYSLQQPETEPYKVMPIEHTSYTTNLIIQNFKINADNPDPAAIQRILENLEKVPDKVQTKS